MSALVVYESMFGNTRKVAEAIARGLGDAVVLPVSKATADTVAGADLLVVGGPTHMHTMSRPGSREMAVRMAAKPDSNLHPEPLAAGPGLREWLAGLGRVEIEFAAFATRGSAPAAFTGRAAKAFHRRLRRHGAHPLDTPHSFVIDKNNAIPSSELSRAELWGNQLADAAHRRPDLTATG